MISFDFSFRTLLLVILLGGFIFGYFYFSYISRKKISREYPLLFQTSTFEIRILLLSILIMILSLGLLYPYTNLVEKGKIQKGIDVIFLLDVSKSMNAFDFQEKEYTYSRLQIAKESIKKIVTQNLENRYGLVVFAGEAISVSPLTTDSQIFLNFLQSVDYRNINLQGTNLEEAYALAGERFTKDQIESGGSMLVLVSDGGDLDDKTDKTIIRDILKKISVPHAVISIGKSEGAKVPDGRDVFGRMQYQKFRGKEVISKTNKEKLASISEIEDGMYFEISDMQDISNFEDIFSDIEKKAIERGPANTQQDMTRYLSFFAFILFCVILIFPLFKRRK